MSYINNKFCSFNSLSNNNENHNDYRLEIKVFKDSNKLLYKSTDVIMINSSKLLEELEDLKKDKKSRLYLAFLNHDIDIYKCRDHYVIENSPNEMHYIEYHISINDYEEIMKCLNHR